MFGIFRRSEGCIAEAFQSNLFQSRNKLGQNSNRIRNKTNEEEDGCEHRPNGLESNLLEVLRKNYDIVSALADIDSSEVGNHTNYTQQYVFGTFTFRSRKIRIFPVISCPPTCFT
ncbi:hypothetical protein NECAME_15972 [Necator americanus]|uniref:Uncharacterized protein n=1 Tax=Necator americanus TaxID=51031 RepID=W2SH27_NECAM|nr:hypothetical protein NECAME_15972 [Necator americanus]ETN68191.1 hypothetical protein NECAME_15972 [Necator americanus]